MQLTRRALIAGLALLLSCGSAMAQYPEKPVRLVVPFPPGGPTDVFARVLSIGLAEQLGQQVVIDNKAGAGGTVGTDLVAKAKPDGYTLLFGTAATHGINVSLYETLPYDPLKDFELIALAGLVPMVLLVPPDQPRVLKELIAKLKSEPGKATYASSGNGTTNHLAGELFKSRAGVDAVHVPYRGSGPALQDLMGGRVTFMFDSFGTSLEQIKAGKLYAVAIMADKRSQARPDVPTTAEAGLRDFVGGTWNVVAAPELGLQLKTWCYPIMGCAGYRGYFDLDFLIDTDSGEVYLGELNPRICGASPMTNHAAFAYAETFALDATVDVVGLDHDLHLDLGQKIDHVFRAAIQLGMAFLPPEPLRLQHRDALQANLVQRVLHLIQFERLNDSLDLFHARQARSGRASPGVRLPERLLTFSSMNSTISDHLSVPCRPK